MSGKDPTNGEDLEPIDPSLAGLFKTERLRPSGSEEAKGRALERLASAIGSGGGGGDDGGSGSDGGGESGAGTGGGASAGGVGGEGAIAGLSTGSTLMKMLPILGAFAIGGAAGGTAVEMARPPRVIYVESAPTTATSAPVPRPFMTPSAVASLIELPTVAPTPDPSVEVRPAQVPSSPSSPKSFASPSASSSSSSVGRDVALARERALLDGARTSMSQGNSVAALEALDRHAKEFPQGQMLEEREAIGVQALVKLGRKAEASARAERFRATYPRSLFLPVVEAALAANR